MNDMMIRLVARVDAWAHAAKDEEGSQALEAAGAALAAAAIVALLSQGAGFLGNAVKSAFERAAQVIGG